MRPTWPGILSIILLTACNGGGGSTTGTPESPGPGTAQSPGGIWFALDSSAEQVAFYIAETGMLRAVLRPNGGNFASFGGGSVSVSSNNAINGSFELRGALSPTFQRGEDLGCSVSGTAVERQTLTVDLVCSDSGGIVYDESLTMMYEKNGYERDSSLEAIMGNYTLEFQSDTNSLDITGDGSLTGMYHSGARCMVNGNASIIDPRYTLIGITWTFSACTDMFGIYEGVQMTGFALANPAPVGDPGSYYFFLTGHSVNGIYTISVLYDPVN